MMLTGEDKITAAKKHEHPISFNCTTKLIFSCNNIPPTSNKDSAFYRRWIILPFQKQTPEDEIDKTLKNKLAKEFPGILNWALEGLSRLLENQKFSYWMDEKEVKDLYERSSDSIQSFIYNNIDIEDSEGVMKKREVYKEYQQYCQQNELPLENQIKFGRNFLALTGCGVCKQNKIPAYQGVTLKNSLKTPKLGEFNA